MVRALRAGSALLIYGACTERRPCAPYLLCVHCAQALRSLTTVHGTVRRSCAPYQQCVHCAQALRSLSTVCALCAGPALLNLGAYSVRRPYLPYLRFVHCAQALRSLSTMRAV